MCEGKEKERDFMMEALEEDYDIETGEQKKRDPVEGGVLYLTDEENKEISALLNVPGINSIFIDTSSKSPSLIRYITSTGYHLTVSDYKVILLLHKKFNLEGI